jgi:putative ABC transport system ATP-binding protein
MTTPRLQARGLVRRFGPTTALAGVDVDLDEGELLAIMGPSGSGKSTLLHVLAGILAPDAGSVVLQGREVGGLNERERSLLRRERYGFVFQFGQLLDELPAVENVALPAMLQGTGRKEAVSIAAQWLAALGLAGKEQRRPGELSGGEAQRVAVARALITGPAIVFADEPTGALDQTTGHEVMDVLTRTTRAAGASLVLVTHDEQVAAWCDRQIDMRDGRVVDAPRAAAGYPADPARRGVPAGPGGAPVPTDLADPAGSGGAPVPADPVHPADSARPSDAAQPADVSQVSA